MPSIVGSRPATRRRDTMARDGLSTSALARLLELPLQQLFATLKDYGWIRNVDNTWELTAKGEFEGGRYVNSKRYGRYIVWPATIVDHPLLRAMESQRSLAPADIGRSLSVSARQINRYLSVMGWIRSGRRGWEPTPAGVKHGAQLYENPQSGQVYVMWPEDIIQQPALLTLRKRDNVDLSDPSTWCSIDGNRHDSYGRTVVANWLFLAGLRYALEFPLGAANSVCDFYLPEATTSIELWSGQEHADQLAARLEREKHCKAHNIAVVDVHPEELEVLDDYLSRRLTELGVAVL